MFDKLHMKIKHWRNSNYAELANREMPGWSNYLSDNAPTSDDPLDPRLNDALIALLINLDPNIVVCDESIWLHKLPPHIRFRHDNLVPFFVHAVNCTHGLVKLLARG